MKKSSSAQNEKATMGAVPKRGRSPMKTPTMTCIGTACRFPGSTTSMLQCNRCGIWFHFQCVGASDDALSRVWICNTCSLEPTDVLPKKGTKSKGKELPSSNSGKNANKHCPTCGGLDTDAMVQCDDCDRWHHFKCAGVTEAVADISWRCTSCENSKITQKHVSFIRDIPVLSTKPSIEIDSLSNTVVSSDNSRFLTVPITNIPPNVLTYTSMPASTFDLMNTYPPSQLVPTMCSAEFNSANPSYEYHTSNKSTAIATTTNVLVGSRTTSGIIPRVSTATETIASMQANDHRNNQFMGSTDQQNQKAPSSTKSSVRQRRVLLDLQKLHQEERLIEEEYKKKKEILNRRFDLMQEIASNSSSTTSIAETEPKKKVEDWLDRSIPEFTREARMEYRPLQQQNPCIQQQCSEDAQANENTHRHSAPLNQMIARMQPKPYVVNTYARPNMGKESFIPVQQSTPQRTTGFPHANIDNLNSFSNSHALARQAASRELPTFTGVPEEWPLFISTFYTTTSMCGYTQEENLLRLQKSLRGKAFDAVKCMLMHPSNVECIMSTLKMLFGSPEVIIHNLISRIQSTPPPRADRLETVIEFALVVKNLCATIVACQMDEYIYNVELVRELVDKLPTQFKVDWARHRRLIADTRLTSFCDWLYELAETISPIAMLSCQDSSANKVGRKVTGFLNAHSEPDEIDQPAYAWGKPDRGQPNTPPKSCNVCKGECNSLEKCKRFIEMSYKARWAAVNEFYFCKKCLGKHPRMPCKSQRICGTNGCLYKHHPLLHNPAKDTQGSTQQNPESSVVHRDCNIHHYTSNQALFRVVPVVLYGPNRKINTFAFLDDGSSLTLMESSLASELGVSGKVEPLCLRWTGNKTRQENSENITIEISGVNEMHKRYRLPEVLTVSNLDLFHQTLDMDEMRKRYSHLRGIQVESYEGVQPRILIGSNNANLGYVLKGREGKMHEPVATKTRLGWIVYGGAELGQQQFLGYHGAHRCSCQGEQCEVLHQAMQKYFSIDGLGITKPTTLVESKEDTRARRLLESMKRRKDGRFETRLLWKYDHFQLPESKSLALRRYACLETRMNKDPDLKASLYDKVKDYVLKGYIRKLTEAEIEEKNPRVWYLPVFPVFNPNKPKKIRIVWDAAAKSHGTALNSLLLTGPDQNSSLTDVLFRFRENRIAVCGDICEMYHQVLVAEEDQHCQRFLWRENPHDSKISEYVMQVMTFGACCSPSCAQFAKNMNAREYAGQYPRAASAIIENHYVDDMLIATETVEEAICLAKEVRYIHAQAGFEMRNWVSNSPEVLETLNGTSGNEKNLNYDAELSTEKVLGMWWCTISDSFTFKLSPKHEKELLSGECVPTKRQVLRTLMAVFDPLGLLSNLMIYLKILLQEVWRTSIDWDEKIPSNIFKNWLQWLAVLPKVQSVSVPRCYRSNINLEADTIVQLHTFVDASELGYAAVVYLRFEYHGKIETSIVAAKARVAPLKFLSIPRMELEAAVIGARLTASICKALSLNINQRFFWSDSRDVLCWIRSDHRRYSQYVGHRVSEILETTRIVEWRWIPSEENVADEGTKWQKPPELTNDCRWFNGPEFLHQNEAMWPVERNFQQPTTEELRKSVYCHEHISLPKILFDSSRFGSWNHLRRTSAMFNRFIQNIKNGINATAPLFGPLSGSEIQQGEIRMFRQAQQEHFAMEIKILSCKDLTQKGLPTTSNLFEFWPFLDSEGVLRAKTRIGACDVASMDTKNPIILPKDSHISWLIVQHYHVRFYHRNHRTVLNELKQRFRIIPKLASLYKKVQSACQVCKNMRAAPHPPPMSDLPVSRVSAFTRPFSYVGVDYFGPLNVTVKRSTEKRWGVLITCLTVRAIHIEIAHSLSAQSCIMALRNFMGRRGIPIQIVSDRGTNMIGASKELLLALKELNQDMIIQEISSPDTTWTFIPPASPHMGGSWERMIQTVKRNLNQISPRHQPTDEVLRNLLNEVENVVNSRPLTHLEMEDPESPVLTPNHFLLGSSNGLKPATLFDDSSKALNNTWRTCQVEANIFWKRWVRDYLPEITRRSKWLTPVKSIEIDDIVVVVDPNLPRNCWPLGRVISVIQGKDKQVRAAIIQTATGIYERPAVKLAVLDVRRGIK
ncbi:uncharacterized protein LOC129752034 [Uranotaenia lowii]|uniref:uncharacterized protein LOC129752034 n=1 Tax=Uranotaenia lowii TaxID=190385 RepID=UPI00247AE98D|nr:uncharacterized protein LOC129752034 [Uranotaenia lowii]